VTILRPLPIDAGLTPTDANAVAMLEEMLRIRSESRDESALAAYLASRMRDFGLDALIDGAGNAVGTTRSEGVRRTLDIVLLGHMDTVPGDIPVRREGDLLYGRGAVDAKGPLAAFVIAAATARPAPGVRFVVVGAVEEECATSKGARFVATQYRPQACIIGEPSHWDAVTLGYKGRLLVSFELTHAAAHSAGADEGVADIAHAWWVDVLARTEAINRGRRGVFDTLQARLRTVNTQSDGLRDTARIGAGFRLPPGVDPSQVEALCRDSAAAICPDAVLTFSGAEVAHAGDRHTGLVRAFTNAIRDAGGKPGLKVKTGTSDMNVVAPVWRCPIIAYGPGDSALDHTPNEHISITEFLRSIGVLRAALERLSADVAAGAFP
jgi:LysW-gamma-L-lysine carboxypeptidase